MMKYVILLIISFSTCINLTAQIDTTINNSDVTEEKSVFMLVETIPSFPGGEAARIQFLIDNIVYPARAKELGISGTVYASFIIEKDGKLNDIKILRGLGGGLDEEVIRVIGLMPPWNPGKQKGKAVRVQMNMPVKFTLSDVERKKKRKQSKE